MYNAWTNRKTAVRIADSSWKEDSIMALSFLHKLYRAVGRGYRYTKRSTKRSSPKENKAEMGLFDKGTMEMGGDGKPLVSATMEKVRVKTNSYDRNVHRKTLLDGGGPNALKVFFYDDNLAVHKDLVDISRGSGFVAVPLSMVTPVRQALKKYQDRVRHLPKKKRRIPEITNYKHRIAR